MDKIYDFDQPIDRRGTDCFKWDALPAMYGRDDLTPMWVADMDFRTPDFVREAVINRAKYDVYGYTFREDAYFEAIANWIRRRHQWDVQKEWMTYTPGVVAAFNMAVMGLTKEGDEIIIQPPVYPPFFHAVESHNRKLVLNPLIDTDDGFVMDYELLEKQAKTAKMLILSNPHNPVGRCWSREELKKLGDICLKNNVLVFSDEIHCDLVLPGFKHTPFASVCKDFEQHCITAHAASKTFNLAGMATSTIIIANPDLRKQYVDFVDSTEINLGNIFGKIATKTAMEQGEEWLQQLLQYIKGNIDYVVDYINKELPEIRVHRAQATYMLWLDFSAYGFDNQTLNHKMIFEAGLGLNNGKEFGKQGEQCLRINLACPRSVVVEAMERMKRVFA